MVSTSPVPNTLFSADPTPGATAGCGMPGVALVGPGDRLAEEDGREGVGVLTPCQLRRLIIPLHFSAKRCDTERQRRYRPVSRATTGANASPWPGRNDT